MNNSEDFAINMSDCMGNVLQTLSAIRATQEVAYHNRFDEIKKIIDNKKYREPFLFLESMFGFDGSIRKFFDYCHKKQQPLHTIFAFKYNVPVSQIKAIDCDLKDNKEFWKNFCDDLSAENSGERYVLAHVILIGMAELQRPKAPYETNKICNIRREETSRVVDIFIKFYQAQIEFDNSDKDFQARYPICIDHYNRRNLFIHDSIPFDRDFTTYQTKYIPDILLKVGEFLKFMFNHDDVQETEKSLRDIFTKLDDEPQTAEVIKFRPRGFKPKVL